MYIAMSTYKDKEREKTSNKQVNAASQSIRINKNKPNQTVSRKKEIIIKTVAEMKSTKRIT
jgi:hypothetical protein